MKQEVLQMCKQAIVLDTIKRTKDKGGMTSAQIKLAEAQSEDYADMKKEIQELKTEVADVKKEINAVNIQLAKMVGNIDIILKNSEVKSTLLNSKYFWIFLTVFICIFAGVTHLSDIAKFFGG